MKLNKGAAVRRLVTAVTGTPVDDGQYVGKKVYPRAGSADMQPGVVTNTSICTLSGCGGTRLHVKWPDGARTYPCARGCACREDGDLQIK